MAMVDGHDNSSSQNHEIDGNFHVFNLAGLIITLDFINNGTVPKVPEKYKLFQNKKIYQPPDFYFRVNKGIPHISDSLRNYQMKTPIWNLSEVDGDLLYELHFPDPSKRTLLIRFIPDSREGIIYTQNEYGKNPVYPLIEPIDEALLISALASRGGLLMHACGLVRDGRALLFSGFSGIGKSTTASLWKERHGIVLLNDDRIFLRMHNGVVWAYSTPWSGSNLGINPFKAPLDRIYFLNQSLRNRAIPLNPLQSASRLFVNAFPAIWDKEYLEHNLDTVQKIVSSVPCYDFYFKPDQSAVDYIECQL